MSNGCIPVSPSSQAGLLPPSPLGTDREGLPSISSSLSNAPFRTRFHYFFSHSSECQGLGAQGVGQEALQSFNLTPPLGLCRLHNTRLQPTNVPVCSVPFDRGPDFLLAGERTRICCHTCHLLFLPSHTRTPIGSSYDSLSSHEEEYGLTTFRQCAIGWVRDYLFAGGVIVCERRDTNSSPVPLTFWFKSISIFDLSILTTFISSSHLFPIPSTLAPDRSDASSRSLPSRIDCHSLE